MKELIFKSFDLQKKSIINVFMFYSKFYFNKYSGV